MKRSPALVPLSHDHHQALAIAQRLRRAEDVAQATRDFDAFWAEHGREHFRIEEEVLLPTWALLGSADAEHVARVAAEHLEIRAAVLQIKTEGPDLERLRRLGELLQAHVRYEERELFPLVEDGLDQPALDELAVAISAAESA